MSDNESPVIEYERITLRIPKDVHQRLSVLAGQKSRSMNAEIISRLRGTLAGETEGFTPADRALLEAISAQLGINPKR
ncbi:Arc family DNA-binding protein [Pseudomonas aeruginosa]|uniref:Arc family DNA-binding protein n=1 Tax=Pseudomonas aeruginosa TaxID=287 RepID=UPI000EB5F932|nr:Arc family DNA-binding protein [Pseudomonas aeruginosa]